MSGEEIERFFCNKCKSKTKHFIRSDFQKTDDAEIVWSTERWLIVECCGCESLAAVRATLFSEDVSPHLSEDEVKSVNSGDWILSVFPPVSYRTAPPWFEDLPDDTLQTISTEIYRSLGSGSHYLATFGSRTLIDRLIVLIVGDQDNFSKGLKALEDDGKLSQHEKAILTPVVDAGNAAAHRGWSPSKEQIAIIL